MKMLLPSVIFLVTFIIRTYKIEKGDYVVWDEAHFGKFSSKYLSRSFYFDVHPPLGKLLTAFAGFLFDQPLDFKFESGSEYPKAFDFSGMRRFHSFISSLTPVFSYLILKEMRYSTKRRFLLTLMFIFENGFTSIGRLVLLDSHLLTCTSAVIYFLTRVFHRSFNDFDLLFLGTALGLVLSIKWIGCFTTAVVGILIIHSLWNILNSKKPFRTFLIAFLKDAFFLILVPISIYIGIYYIHFKIVNKSSPDEGHMSSFFQATLVGNSHIKNRRYIAYGTKITLKSNLPGGGYLHSHENKYPDIEANQVTTYTHKDNNNNWVLQKVTNSDKEALFVKDKEEVVLYHLESEKYIGVAKKSPYLSEGLLTISVPVPLTHNNVFVIEIVEDSFKYEDNIKSLTTKFMLRHTETGTYLKSTSRKYPEWAFNQGEIVCSSVIDEGSYWTVEENISDKIPVELNPLYDEIYKNIFIKNFIEHNILQYNVNKSFVQDDNLEPERIVSNPKEWPLLIRGLRMCTWEENKVKFYMFGNPLLWYTSTLCVLLAPVIFLIRYIRYRRGLAKFKKMRSEGFEVFIGFGGWMCHYLPFFAVGRVLYFHHYYPALFFALLSVCYVFKYVNMKFLQTFIGCSIYFYLLFSPLTYGFLDTSTLSKLKFLPSWDFID
ncbi:hypothetical protein P3W45_001570 [Vairimorpha bombi]|jgi:dolichyl-phosphate-mannose-protein mannosyltransferase